MGSKFPLHTLCVAPGVTLLDAIKTLTAAAKKIVLVIDEDQRLLGVVTDFDVRKAILNHAGLDEPVSEIMKKEPVTALASATQDEIISTLENERISQLPITDEDGTLVDIQFIDDYRLIEEHQKERIAVIMAGGLGTRLKPMTDYTPKPLLSIGGRPILFIMLDQILTEGFDRIYVTLNYKSDMIVDALKGEHKYDDQVEFIFEDTPLGTAGSLSLLPERPKDPFVVINADLLTNLSLGEMSQFHIIEENAMTIATKREQSTIPYGVAELDGTRIIKLNEKPSYTYFINTGVYIVNPDVLNLVYEKKYMDMTEIVSLLLDSGQRVGSFPVHEYWLDIGNHDRLEKAQEDYVNHFAPNNDPALD